MPPNFGPRQVPSPRQVVKGKIEIARILSLTPPEFAKLIEDLESNPLFLKLFSSPDRNFKVIHRRTFNRAALSSQFYELPENLTEAVGGDVETLLDAKKPLVDLIRRMGQDKFEKYFLHSNGEYTRGETANACGLTEAEVDSILQLMNKVFLETEMHNIRPVQEGAPQLRYSVVGQAVADPKHGFSIAFTSPRMAQGLYQVDHKKLQDLRKGGFLSSSERELLNTLLSRMSLINARKNSLYLLLLFVLDRQRKFFETENEEHLTPLTQRQASAEIRVSPSSVCRLLYARSLLTPGEKEWPLDHFFPSRKAWLKERLRALFSGDPLTDRAVQNIIKKQYGIALSRRSVNQYRKEVLGRK